MFLLPSQIPSNLFDITSLMQFFFFFALDNLMKMFYALLNCCRWRNGLSNRVGYRNNIDVLVLNLTHYLKDSYPTGWIVYLGLLLKGRFEGPCLDEFLVTNERSAECINPNNPLKTSLIWSQAIWWPILSLSSLNNKTNMLTNQGG